MTGIPQSVKQAAADLGVDKPIMSYKVVGDRIEMYLYGGSVVKWSARPIPKAASGHGPDLAGPPYEGLSYIELRRLATKRKIRRRSKMSRTQLIEALEATSDQVDANQ